MENRTQNSIKNSISAVLTNLIAILVGFVAQKIFIKSLGVEYLGLHGLFNNIISMLAIVELGIGPAIVYHLYEPLAKQNIEKIKSIMNFYKKAYNVIAIVVFVVGICILPFLNLIVNTTLKLNIYFVFILYLIDSVFSYILSYKRSILQADQKAYIINIIHAVYIVVLNTIQISILLLTKNYMLYLIIRATMRLIENVVISKFADKKYTFLKEKDCKDIDTKMKEDLIQKVKGLIFHKIGGFVVMGTDNIIISKMLGTVVVGYYSNYYLIVNSVSTLFVQIFSALIASVGNLLVTTDKDKIFDVFKKLMLIDFWIFGLAGTLILTLMEPFITMWLGKEFVLEFSVLVVLIINFYMLGMRSSIGIYKEAAGIFWEDRFVPVIESVTNIVFSIILAKYWGLTGVFIGTTLSTCVIAFYGLPHFVFSKVFERKSNIYYVLYFKYGMVALIGAVLSRFICTSIVCNNTFIQLIFNGIVTMVTVNITYYIILKNTDEFKYFISLIKKIANKIIKKEE